LGDWLVTGGSGGGWLVAVLPVIFFMEDVGCDLRPPGGQCYSVIFHPINGYW
jgi:hypothetical protein